MDGVCFMFFFFFRVWLGFLEGMGGSGIVGGVFCGFIFGVVIVFLVLLL